MEAVPFFSVVIPVYNSEKYLDDCISSIFEQGCQDFELILIDDESKDKSAQICDKWGKKYPDKVRVFHQKNTGVYIAKRNGIKASRGRFIFVIDNDDLITKATAFEEIKNKILETNCDLAFFNATDDITTGHLLVRFPFTDGQVFVDQSLSEIYDNYLMTKDLHHIWMMVFSRDLFDWDYEYPESFRMLRDGPFLILPIISNAKKILYIDDTYYYWRIQNESSASKHYNVVDFFYSVRTLHKRIVDVSAFWKYKSEKTDDYIKKNYIADVCIAAIKVRSISKESAIKRNDCLKMMSNDEYFRNEYSLSYLENYRKPIAFALYHKLYWLVNVISSMVGLVKKL